MNKHRFWKNKKVLITGFEGFLGSNLTLALLRSGANVIGIDCVRNRPFSLLNGSRKNIIAIKGDVIRLELVRKIVDRYRPGIVFHLAAEPIVQEGMKNPTLIFRSNIEGTWNVLESCRGKDFLEAMVVASSDKAYGNHRKLPYDENFSLRGQYPYDVSKSCVDLLSSAYFYSYGLPVCITRCGNVYGPGDGHFSRIVPATIDALKNKKSLMIRSDGKFVRDFIYVDDIISGFMLLAEKMQRPALWGEAFNLSSGRPVSVLELVREIFRLAGAKPNYRILNKARGELRKQYLSPAKARRLLGWRPRYPLKLGLRNTIDWYRSDAHGVAG